MLLIKQNPELAVIRLKYGCYENNNHTDRLFNIISGNMSRPGFVNFGNIPAYEVHFQNFVYLLFTLMGFYTNVEYHTPKGRADVIIKTDKYIYVMELKRDSSAKDAMMQIKNKDFAKPFQLDGRKIILVGANFALDMGNWMACWGKYARMP
ncbi:MAG: PD-(D/E)XK nuclease domain-containing protein [Proteobacteria bacterium]|nr:PD-(D/E)XK nuclease domain-containing protein [Pseudomonadota bacterium]